MSPALPGFGRSGHLARNAVSESAVVFAHPGHTEPAAQIGEGIFGAAGPIERDVDELQLLAAAVRDIAEGAFIEPAACAESPVSGNGYQASFRVARRGQRVLVLHGGIGDANRVGSALDRSPAVGMRAYRPETLAGEADRSGREWRLRGHRGGGR